MLNLVHLNVEGSKHFERIYPFLEKRNPDVVCMQELPEEEVPRIADFLEAESFFVPMANTEEGVGGIGIFSRHSIARCSADWYGGSKETLPKYDETDYESRYTTSRFVVAVCDINKGSKMFRIATTHFPVTEHGKVTDYQKESLDNLSVILTHMAPFVLTGDFNAPRGGEIFSLLAANYTDNVPEEYETSIDTTLHRAVREGKGHEIADKMVDGIFSTDEYVVSNVEMICGVSDHCALVATISQ